jgi:uncharacterized membrane protein
MRVLYAGDSEVGGPANFLLGILNSLRAKVIHISPQKILSNRYFAKPFDAIILSDYPEHRVPETSQRRIMECVNGGAGLLMVGGWSSFSGPSGGWRGSIIEELLPVTCLEGDDRVNFSNGGLMIPKRKHPSIRFLNFKNPPSVAGLNKILPKKNSQVVLCAKAISVAHQSRSQSYSIAFEYGEYPLLVVDGDPEKRIAALATDLAPHWCGGILDWGKRRVLMNVTPDISVETGYLYHQFVSSLIKWLAPKPRVVKKTMPAKETVRTASEISVSLSK